MSFIANYSLTFGRALTSSEKKDFINITKEAKELLGNTGDSILIIPDTSLPSDSSKDIGMGSINTQASDKFFGFMKDYIGINAIKVLPQGEYGRIHNLPYSGSALSLGVQLIDLEKLTQDKYGKILLPEEFDELVNSNKKNNKDMQKYSNYKNIIKNDSDFNKLLKKSYNRFKSLDQKEYAQLIGNFDKFKNENNDWLEPKSIFRILSKKYDTRNYKAWPNKIDRDLYDEKVLNKERKARIKELNNEYKEEIDFYKFTQFLSEENLKESKNKLNEKGLKLYGDCLIGFSEDEIWSNPKAFEEAYIGNKIWGLPCLKYSDILDQNSESAKLLKKKVELFAKRYDGIRFDVAWCYINPVISPINNSNIDQKYKYDETINAYRTKEPLNDKILKVIDNTVKEVKGKDYNLNNLIYEIEAGPKDFQAFIWDDNGKAEIISALKDRKIVMSTFYMNNYYGNINFLKHNLKLPEDNFVIMTNNHDHVALRKLAELDNKDTHFSQNELKNIRNAQIEHLHYYLKIDKEKLLDPKEFVKAKFAQIFTVKNNKLFFMDVFGRKEQFDKQNANIKYNYEYKISNDYESEYHKSLQEGNGLNIMDAFDKAFVAKGLDQSNPKLYKKIVKYRDILNEKGVTTEVEANKIFNKKGFNGKILVITAMVSIIPIALYLILRNKDSKS